MKILPVIILVFFITLPTNIASSSPPPTPPLIFKTLDCQNELETELRVLKRIKPTAKQWQQLLELDRELEKKDRRF